MNTDANTQEPGQHLFADEELFAYQQASTMQRFLNLVIDNLLLQFGLSYLTGYILAKVLVTFAPDTAYELFSGPRDGTDVILVAYLTSILNYLLYYTVCEKLFKGYTLGKLVTGTRTIREDGAELTLANALLRSLSRLVPFEPFSAFGGHPWHDRWTKTMVVKTR